MMNQLMAALYCGVPGVGPVFAEEVEFGGVGGRCLIGKKAKKKKKRRRVQFRGSVRFVGVRAGPSGFYTSRLGLDSQTFPSQESSQMLWVGPVPGDIAEIEAYCRIFRAAEQLHTATMQTVCNPETGECTVSYNFPSEDLPMLEEKVVTMLGCMLALLNRGREEVLSGRSSFADSFQAPDLSVLDGRLPPLAIFRGEMKRCCESLHVALANYLTPFDDRSTDIWRKLQRLRNVCYDAGFPHGEGYPSPTTFANWSPVCLSNKKEETTPVDCEVAFWKGGQVTDEGLDWLLKKGYKTIVDLRDEAVNDKYYQAAIQNAVSCGKLEVVSMPVEVGTAPSMEQVEQFALLVSDLSRRPIYLHSQEGVSRTSAMVSRWKQYISRSVTPRTTQTKLNGKTKEDVKVHDQLEVQKLVSLKQGVSLLSDENGSPLKGVDTNVADDVTRRNHIKSDFTIQNEDGSGKVTACSDNVVKEESGLGYTNELDPLKSQFPEGDIFSRREMTQFFKNKKLTPQTYLDFQRARLVRGPTSRQSQRVQFGKKGTNVDTRISEMMKPVKSNGTCVSSDSFSRPNDGDGYHCSDLNPAFVLDMNGYHEKERYDIAQPSASRSVSSDLNGQILSVAIDEGRGLTSNGSSKSVTDNVDFVEENMCASTTGVVRVQSRKKAEMFLVRTDGFSCTREKVTESSLAFTHPSTQQQMLMWKSLPKTVLLLKKLGKELMKEAKEVASFLHHQEKMNVLVEPDVHDMFARLPGFGFIQTFYSQDTSDLHERVDFVACLGGDGVILHASNIFRGAVPPVVSFNLGSLGFLATHTFEDYMQDLRALIHGNNTVDGVYITLRMRLRCEIFRNGKAMPGKIFDVLNEVVADRGSNPYISKIECYEHNRLITKVQGDGVIVATPTGSTAYSTAAGGSMVHPNVPCMLFTPICPHSLSFRPVILPDSAQLELKIPKNARSNAWVSFDGKRRQQLSRGDSVKIYMSQHPLPTVNKFDQTGDWFRSLIRCLNWNERLEQRAL